MKNLRQIEQFCDRIGQRHGIGIRKRTLYAMVSGIIGIPTVFILIVL